MTNRIYTKNVFECFHVDVHKYNPIPKGIIKKVLRLKLSQRYSMPVYLRLTEYFYAKFKDSGRYMYKLIAQYFRRRNEIVNQFEHGFTHNIFPGTLFHHTGVTLTDSITINAGVQLFNNITLAKVDGSYCKIGENSIIFSNVIILGVEVGDNCVIGAGSVVTSDVPDNSIIAGVPGKIIGECENTEHYLEYK